MSRYSTMQKVSILIVLMRLSSSLLTMSSATSKSVLVIGGTGRVGRALVPKLINNGYNVRVMCRDIEKAKELKELSGAEIVYGDVCEVESLVEASKDCSTIVSVHGMKPSRFTKITDLFTPPGNIPYHPYNINYLGVRRILTAMEINKCEKIIRITGAQVDKSAFKPFKVLFNGLLSMTSKWHEASEIAIRNSGFDYTVIRPTEIVDQPPVASSVNKSLCLVPGDAPGKSIIGHIPIQDLADLLLLSVRINSTSSTDSNGSTCTSNLSKTSVVCSTKKVPGETVWTNLVDTMPKDTRKIVLRNHEVAVALYGTVIASVLALLARSFFLFIRKIVWIFVTFYTKNPSSLFAGF